MDKIRLQEVFRRVFRASAKIFSAGLMYQYWREDRDSNPQSNQFNSRPQLTGAAVKVSSSSLNAAMPGQRFQNVDGSALVGKVGEERSASTVTAGTFNTSTFVQQRKCLCQAV